MVFKLTPEESFIRERTRLAITQATENDWQSAANTNLELLEIIPNDVEASNRLGRAYIELGKFAEATKAFKYSLSLSPHNTIASKNIERLSTLDGGNISSNLNVPRIPSSTLFIADSGKSTKLTLHIGKLAGLLTHFAAGSPLKMLVEGDCISVFDSIDQRLGMLPPKLGFRLSKLIAGGNKYEAVFVSCQADELSVLIREVYQDPSQRKLVSFPPQSELSVNQNEEQQDIGTTNATELKTTDVLETSVPSVDDSLLNLSEDDLLLTETEDLDEPEDLDGELDESDELEDDLDGEDAGGVTDPLDDDDSLEVSSLDSEIDAELEDDEDELD